MAIKKYKPTTPGRRGMTVTDYSGLSKVAPERSLLEPMKKAAGRNNTGRITVRHHGGGNRTKYRVIDFKRDKWDVPAEVKTLEYDPNRSAHIALVQYEDGEKRYILAPEGLKVGDKVVSGPNADIKPGNCLPFANIPVGTVIHNIELYPGKGAQLVRSAGNMAQLMAKEGKYALVRLPSGEMRNVPMNCMATVGQVGNLDHENVNIGKAGRKRHMGWRPTVRGSVMNPCDHPHGGGEGKSPVGRPGPVTPVGQARHGLQDPQTSRAQRQVHRQACEQQIRRRAVMGRSVKKGPYVQPVLLKRVQAMNEAGEKRVLKTWSAPLRSSRISWATPSRCTTGASTCLCTSPRTWWATSWASSPRRAPSRATRAARPPANKR